MEVGLMVTKCDNRRQSTTDDRVNIEQSSSGRLEGRVLQLLGFNQGDFTMT